MLLWLTLGSDVAGKTDGKDHAEVLGTSQFHLLRATDGPTFIEFQPWSLRDAVSRLNKCHHWERPKMKKHVE